MSAILEAVGVQKSYRGGDGSIVPVLTDVQLTVRRGEAVAIVGARKPTPYGRAVAERLADDLAGRRIENVGLAAAIATSDSPLPKPISSTRDAVLPNTESRSRRDSA